MKFAFILFTFCIFGCGGSGGSVEVPAAFVNASTATRPTTVTNTTTTNTTTVTNTNSGNTSTDNSVNNSYNNVTTAGGQ